MGKTKGIRKGKKDDLCLAHFASQLAIQVNPQDPTLQDQVHSTTNALRDFDTKLLYMLESTSKLLFWTN